jgi:hypothetical protein
MVKAMSFKDVIESVKRKQAEFEALPKEEQERQAKEQAEAIKEFYANGGTAMGFGIGGKK